jgi:predicted nucleotidyltransferase
MDSKELIKKLESKKEHYQSRYGFSEIFLFGSYAENNANPDSDIDIAVTVDSGFKTYKNFIAAKEELSQDLFNKEIDLVYFNSINLNPIIKDEIERKRIRIG